MKLWDLVWAAWFALFIALELPAAFSIAPWHTLSTVGWDVEQLNDVFRILIAAGLFILLVHIVARWP